MFKQIASFVFIAIMAWTCIVHILRLCHLYFKLPFVEKLKFIRLTPGKLEMAMYYLLVVGTVWYVIYLKLHDWIPPA